MYMVETQSAKPEAYHIQSRAICSVVWIGLYQVELEADRSEVTTDTSVSSEC